MQTNATQPLLQLRLPGVNGSRVALSASFHKDYLGLTAYSPSEQRLANGSHLMYASLNGGEDWSGGPSGHQLGEGRPR